MDAERAEPVTISLYPSHIKAVENYSKYKKYKHIAMAYQEVIEDFFTKDDKKIKYDFILFFIIPIIFCILTTFVNLSTNHVFTILVEKGIYFHELHMLSNIFMILSILSISMFIACIYWLRKVKMLRYNKEANYGD